MSYKKPSKAAQRVYHAQAIEHAYNSIIQVAESFANLVSYYTNEIERLVKEAAECGIAYEPETSFEASRRDEAAAQHDIYRKVAELILDI